MERQLELVQSERLFDLDITAYPELNAIQKDMAGMRLIYDIYMAQKVWQGSVDLLFDVSVYVTTLYVHTLIYEIGTSNTYGVRIFRYSGILGKLVLESVLEAIAM